MESPDTEVSCPAYLAFGKLTPCRTLSPFQRKIMQAYADDVEGNTPNISFDTPPPAPLDTSEGTPTSSSSSRTHPSTPPSSPPEEPESRLKGGESHAQSPESPSGEPTSDSGVLGWAGRLFGGGKK